MSGAILNPSKMSRAIYVYVGSTGIPCLGIGEIGQILHASDRRRWPTTCHISPCQHASEAACAYRSSNVGQRLIASAKACMHQTFHVRIMQETSVNGKTLGMSLGGAAVSADFGGSSKYSNENFEG
uniref:Uncharacterized protein n=1 Tax=Solanum tuberosum TaxID=4113 RepID=M1DSV3_SOLTU